MEKCILNPVTPTKSCQPTILYPARLSFRKEREIKILQVKQNLREFMSIRPAL
jgi:hypothetical protein